MGPHTQREPQGSEAEASGRAAKGRDRRRRGEVGAGPALRASGSHALSGPGPADARPDDPRGSERRRGHVFLCGPRRGRASPLLAGLPPGARQSPGPRRSLCRAAAGRAAAPRTVGGMCRLSLALFGRSPGHLRDFWEAALLSREPLGSGAGRRLAETPTNRRGGTSRPCQATAVGGGGHLGRTGEEPGLRTGGSQSQGRGAGRSGSCGTADPSRRPGAREVPVSAPGGTRATELPAMTRPRSVFLPSGAGSGPWRCRPGRLHDLSLNSPLADPVLGGLVAAILT